MGKKKSTSTTAGSADGTQPVNADGVPKGRKAHANLDKWDTVRLWVAAGGRCQICNRLLTESDQTYTSVNLGERAHMIAQTPGGPRGQAGLSEAQARNIDNLMLLCPTCHKEIDDPQTSAKFPIEVLRRYKERHEERIRYLTKLTPKRTRVLLFTTPIRQPAGEGQPAHDREVTLHQTEAYDAILPDAFPDEPNALRLKIQAADEESEAYWQQMYRKIKSWYDAKVSWEEIEHLSVFALGKIPALAYLGHVIGDARTVQVFNVSNSSPQKWQDAAPAGFKYVETPPEGAAGAKDVLLKLSLSGQVEPGQYRGVVPEDAAVYEIANHPRHQQLNWLVAEKQLTDFTKAYQRALSAIQREFGQDATIHVLTAVPAAVAVEIGRMYRPNSHPQIKIYHCVGKRFSPALTLGGTE